MWTHAPPVEVAAADPAAEPAGLAAVAVDALAVVEELPVAH